MGERRGADGFGRERWGKRDHLENSAIDGRIILRWTFRKWNRGHGRY
jgi:hypothetical protein